MKRFRLGLWVGLLFLPALFVTGCAEKSSDATDANQLADSGQQVAEDAVEGPAITGAEHRDLSALQVEADGELPPLPIEATGKVESLPFNYPETWVLVDEAAFFNMFGGKVIVMDVAEERHAKRMKGLMPKNLLGLLAQSKSRGEIYIMETFHARGGRGPREDVLAIYDKTSLDIVKEIVWPVPKRLTALPERYAMSLSEDEKYLYVTNMDPATSFTVVDLDSREIVAEVGTPGCVMTYPVGNRSVASLCSNGGMLTSVLNENGSLDKQTRMPPFFDTADSAIFEHPVIFDGVAHFPSFHGLLHQVDVSGDEAKYLGNWNMLSQADVEGNWRPSGLVLNDVDDAGNLYIIFQPDGAEGTQTHGGVQVRVYNLNSRELVRVIDTPNWAISIAVTRGENPLLIVTNGELNLDVFNATTGEFIQTVGDFGNSTPLLVNKSY